MRNRLANHKGTLNWWGYPMLHRGPIQRECGVGYTKGKSATPFDHPERATRHRRRGARSQFGAIRLRSPRSPLFLPPHPPARRCPLPLPFEIEPSDTRGGCSDRWAVASVGIAQAATPKETIPISPRKGEVSEKAGSGCPGDEFLGLGRSGWKPLVVSRRKNLPGSAQLKAN